MFSLGEKMAATKSLVSCAEHGDYWRLQNLFSAEGRYTPDLLFEIATRPDKLIEYGILKPEDIPAFAKSLTVCEVDGLLFTGSTNGIWRVAQYITVEDMDWMYQKAYLANPYIPFGSSGRCRGLARTAQQYLACQEEMQREIEQAKLKRLKRLEQKREAGRARLTETKEGQAERCAERPMRIEFFRGVSLLERTEGIARDKRTTIYYYPDDFAEFPLKVIDQLTPELRQRFLQKVFRAKRGRWRQLAIHLKAIQISPE